MARTRSRDYGRETHAKTGSTCHSDQLPGLVLDGSDGPAFGWLYPGRLDAYVACLQTGSGPCAGDSGRGAGLPCARLRRARAQLRASRDHVRSSTVASCPYDVGSRVAGSCCYACRASRRGVLRSPRGGFGGAAGKLSHDMGSCTDNELSADRQLRSGNRLADDDDVALHDLHLASAAGAGGRFGQPVVGTVAKPVCPGVCALGASRRCACSGAGCNSWMGRSDHAERIRRGTRCTCLRSAAQCGSGSSVWNRCLSCPFARLGAGGCPRTDHACSADRNRCSRRSRAGGPATEALAQRSSRRAASFAASGNPQLCSLVSSYRTAGPASGIESVAAAGAFRLATARFPCARSGCRQQTTSACGPQLV